MKFEYIGIKALIFVVAFSSCNSVPEKLLPKKAVITGKMINYEQDTLFMENYSAIKMLLRDEIHKIPLSEDKSFNYTMEIESPGYYKISRSYLYLSPGDSLQMTIDTKSRTTAIFEGRGAEANRYLKSLPYPKGGSFFGDARQNKIEIASEKDMAKTFEPMLASALKALDTLKNVSKEFVALEKARLNFEYINSMQSTVYLFIQDYIDKNITVEEMYAKAALATENNKPFIIEALSKVDYNNTDYLQFEVFPGIINMLSDSAFTNSASFPKLNNDLKDYQLASNLKAQFSRQGYTKDFTDYYDTEIVKIKNEDYRIALNDLLKQYEPLKSGSPAADVIFINLKGDHVKLSDYKGKVIVVDLWATWCGPCMDEKPAYEALADKYKNNDKIEFLSVSIDTKKVWNEYFSKHKPHGIQLQINRSDLAPYQIVSIPRLFVIDKKQNIVDVFAPIPSSGKLEELFKAYL